jgi:hypothetical protein
MSSSKVKVLTLFRECKSIFMQLVMIYYSLIAMKRRLWRGFLGDHQEVIFHTLSLKHESYFTGKLNGNSYRKQMEKAEEWSEKMASLDIYNSSLLSPAWCTGRRRPVFGRNKNSGCKIKWVTICDTNIKYLMTTSKYNSITY